MKKIKILHITQATIGGTLEYIKLLFKYIDKSNYEFELICPSYGPMKKDIEKMGFKVYEIDMEREVNITKDFISYNKISKTIKNINPDIVHVHSSKAGVIGRIASYRCKIPCIYNAHGWSFSMNISNSKKNTYAIIEKITSLFCNRIINISEYEQNLALKYNICKKSKMSLIYNGIDINKYNKKKYNDNIVNDLGIEKNSFVVGMVARVSEQKDPIKFIDIAKYVCDRIENAKFILVGDGELNLQVRSYIDKLCLNDKVIITGWVDNVEDYIKIFDIAILTSRWEGFGLVLAEYMAASKPIVASDVGAIPELIIDGHNGKLVELKDGAYGFGEAIIKLYKDKDLSNKFKKNSLKIVNEKFSIDRVIEQHEIVYRSVYNLDKN